MGASAGQPDAGLLPGAGSGGSGGDADASSDASPDLNDGVLTSGNARFTVITPTLIRMEFADQGSFVDEPTYFAANRDRRYRKAVFSTTAAGVAIDTGVVKLSYTDDGKPFSTSNLSAELRVGDTLTRFSPAAPNTENLGGTTRTLDGFSGARKLDDGILSRAGWYTLDDSHGPLLTGGWVKARARPERDWYLFGYGLDYKAALASLTAIGGAVPLPRRAALGAWYSRYWPYSSADFEQIVQEYDSHDFPLDAVVLDMDWHEDGWTGWSWNKKLIPDPQALMSYFHDRGLVSTLNVHPADGVAPHEDAYASFMQALGKDPKSGETVPFDAANRPYMEALFSKVHAPLTQAGADFFWLDWQQGEFTKGLPTLGNLPWLNELYYRYSTQDGARGLSFSRWGGFGDHRHPIHFSGDAATSFEMLAFEVPFTATSGNSGLFYWTHDIGGHVGDRNEESYTRWCQFGALSAALRSHSTRTADLDRRPWTYADWAEASMKRSFQLRSRLFPYLYASVWQSSSQSIPLLRTAYLEHSSTDEAYKQPQQYFLGDSLLVAPIVEAGVGPSRLGRQVVWFPEGTFYDFFSGERFDGPSEHLVSATIDEFPLYVRAGVPLPMQPFTRRMTTTPTSELVVRCYPGADGQSSSFTLYEDDGATSANADGAFATTVLTCKRQGNDVTVSIDPAAGNYRGQPETRSYVVEIPATNAASSAVLDGAATVPTYTANDFTNRVSVAARSIRTPTVVRVTAALTDPEEPRKRAFATRSGLGDTDGTLQQMVQSAWAAAPNVAEKWAILAAAGSGAVRKNETYYGYPNTASARVYQEPWAKLSSSAVATSWQNLAQLQQAVISYQGESSIIAGDPVFDFDHLGSDLAPLAKASFSSIETSESVGIADRIVGGYPGVRAEEWSAAGEMAGAWATLTWSAPQTVSRVVLFDRINPNDQVTSGELSFSDGTVVSVGVLSNEPNQAPIAVDFAKKQITWLKFTVKSVSATTANVGLAEVAVY